MKNIVKLAVFSSLILGYNIAFSKTIARLQLRASDYDTYSITQSIFHSFGSGYYVLQIYDREENIDTSYKNERFELYLGLDIDYKKKKTPFGVVSRAQKWSGFDPILSAGLMFNPNRVKGLDDDLKSINTRTFFQFFMKNEKEQLGNAELLHYYQINKFFGSKAYVRGNNIYHFRPSDKGGDVVQNFADFIYPLHRYLDVYLRWTYLSKNTQQLGSKGNTSAIGVRFNF